MKKLLLALTIGTLSFSNAPSASAQAAATVLGGTMTVGAAVGLGLAVAVLGVAVSNGSDDPVATTTTANPS